MPDTPVTYEAADGVAWITLNRPAVLNALNAELAAMLADHAETAARADGVTLLRERALRGQHEPRHLGGLRLRRPLGLHGLGLGIEDPLLEKRVKRHAADGLDDPAVVQQGV